MILFEILHKKTLIYIRLAKILFLIQLIINVAICETEEQKNKEAKATSYYQFPIKGIVFEDKNNDKKRDENESPLKNIPVSDGRTIVFTKKDGSFYFNNSDKKAKYVFVCIPNGFEKRLDFYRLLIGEDKEFEIELPLKKFSERKEKSFNFVQITDVHINTADNLEQFRNALTEIAGINLKPEFIIATGDLVGKGDERLEIYQKGVSESEIPIFNMMGNHDCCKDTDSAINFNRFLGPDYYSFNYGKFHFLIVNCTSQNPLQKSWIEEDLEKLAGDKQVLLFQHYQPDKKLLDEYSDYGITAVFSGHWHSTKLFQYRNIRNINSPPLLFGGIDLSPSGFRIIQIDGKKFTSEYRPDGINDFVKIVYPSNDCIIQSERPLDICVDSFDTKNPNKKITATIEGNNFEKKIKLEKRSTITWFSKKPLKDLKPGAYTISLQTDHSNEEKSASIKFQVAQSSKFTKKPVEVKGIWSSFMGSPKHSGVTEYNLPPPLELMWIAPSGGSIDFASPIVADGKVFICVKERNEIGSRGVLALDALTGKKLWFAETKSNINNSPIFYNGLVIAQEMPGRVYAYKSDSGKERWHYDCGDEISRWIYGAPAIADGKLYVGSSKWFAALEPETGTELWHNNEGQDWISSYCSPAVSGDFVINGGNWLDIKSKPHSIYAMENRTGKIQWGCNVSGVHSSPTIDGKKIYCNDMQGRFLVVGLESGEILWEYPMLPKGNNWSAVTPAIKGNIVISGSSDGTVFAFDVEKKSVIWKFKSGNSIFRCSSYNTDYRSLLSSPTISGDFVYFGSGDGNLYGLDINSGEKKWEFSIGVPVLSTPAIVDEWLFVGAYDGNIYAFHKKFGSSQSGMDKKF